MNDKKWCAPILVIIPGFDPTDIIDPDNAPVFGPGGIDPGWAPTDV
jgi:hypothetical protein